MTVYVSDSDILVSDDSVWDLTETLTELGSGVSRTVYDLGDGTVLKVNRRNPWHASAGDNLTEWQAWQEIKDGPFASCFAECIAIADDGSWMIQAAVSYVFSDDDDYSGYSEWWREVGKEACLYHRIGDVHPGNAGVTENGNVLIVDYGWTGGFMDAGAMFGDCSSAEVSESCNCNECKPCTCQDHECSDCFPEGDPCGSLEGCNWTYCDACEIPPRGNDNQNSRIMNAAVTKVWLEGEWHKLCQDHKPCHRSYREIQLQWEAMGQLRLLVPAIVSGRVLMVPAPEVQL